VHNTKQFAQWTERFHKPDQQAVQPGILDLLKPTQLQTQ